MSILHRQSGAASHSVSELRLHDPIDFRVNDVPPNGVHPELVVLAVVMVASFGAGLLALIQIM